MGAKTKRVEGAGTGPAPGGGRSGITLPPTALAVGAAVFLMLGFAGGYMVALNVGPDRGPAPAPEASPAISPEMVALGERLRRDPNDVQALLRLAHVHLDQGQTDVAKGMYQRILELEPRNAEAITHLGTAAAAEDRLDEALRRFDEALAIDPQYAHALWDKAMLLQERKGDPAAAVPVWEAFLQVTAPDSVDARRAREMLAAAREGRAGGAGLSAPGAGPPEPAAQPASLGDTVAQGRRLYEQWGCSRCHAIAGRGGTLGPDLTRAGATPGRDLAWHIRHLKDPAAVVPGSQMPPVRGASEAELRAVSEYMLSLK